MSNRSAALRLLIFFVAFASAAFFLPVARDILVFMVFIGFLVFIHEWGHYVWFKRAGVKVKTFGIGMGPSIATFTRKNGEEWKFCPILVGGYVSPCESSCKKAPALGRLKAILAGPLVNIVFGLALLTALLMWPVPEFSTQITQVGENTPAAQAGIQPGDEILVVNGVEVSRRHEIFEVLSPEWASLSLVLRREGGQIIDVTILPNKEGVTGLTLSDEAIGSRIPHSLPGAAVQSVKVSSDVITQIVKVLPDLFDFSDKGDAASDAPKAQMAGPAKFGKIMSENIAAFGLSTMLFQAALFSIILGVFNLIPLLPLDGGHAVSTLAEMAGKPIPEKVQRITSWIVGIPLLLLTAVWFFWDIIEWFL